MARRPSPLFSILSIFFHTILLIAGAGAWFFLTIPDAKDLKGCLTTTMYKVNLCPGDKSYTRLSSIPEHVRNAIIVSEDAAFWDHAGIDWVEMKKSFETNLERGKIARGGSTITQQLAKNVYLTGEKSITRKLREAVIALRIERQYSKSEILERYMNVVEFDEGVYGIKAAAQHYFNTSPSELTVAQGAWLAFLLPNPGGYAASFRRKQLSPFASKQVREIINRLSRFKRIDDDTRTLALNEAATMFGGSAPPTEQLETELNAVPSDEESESRDEGEWSELEEEAPPAAE